MNQRERILDAVADLTAARRRLPPRGEVADRVGLTKQGVLHYFPGRGALDAAVLERSLARVDSAMNEAAEGGSPVAAYLGLSSPDGGDYAAAAVILYAAPVDMPTEVRDAMARWERIIAEEVGDPLQAEIVRLTGDGLFAEALVTGVAPDADRVERLVAHLRGTHRGRP